MAEQGPALNVAGDSTIAKDQGTEVTHIVNSIREQVRNYTKRQLDHGVISHVEAKLYCTWIIYELHLNVVIAVINAIEAAMCLEAEDLTIVKQRSSLREHIIRQKLVLRVGS